ncbi:uncharacterized protein B0H64DRAFT_458349 [Chaetomium fimeti]|uniref:AB hydrolase-1 domain-containing protein n=1 Tax=Chaetomium fimeti TaxID=1854472 RepID=A0AAE0HLF5_9PEZI|nr:hypothetical protein B0H64DRAFT_458349 [Chaetomium fimeti]
MAAQTAADFLDDPRFNRVFEYTPPGTTSPPFKIKYADYGYRNEAHSEQERIMFFSGPLMASRLVLATKDELAIKHKIRIISADRPGMGGTDPVAPKDRLTLWRDAIPALLQHLHIPHLHAIITHSGGTVYALDLVLHHPTLLLPNPPIPPPSSTPSPPSSSPSPPPQTQQPTTTLLALGAPWILPTHTASLPLSLLQSLPPSLISHTDKLIRLVGGHIAPALGTSAGVLNRLGGASALWSGATSSPADGEEGAASGEVREEERVWPGVMRRVYEEGVAGVSDEALLLLQRGAGAEGGWGDWGDYDGLVPRLGEGLRAAGRRVRMEVFYAESDTLTGDGGVVSKGGKWFDGLWEGGEGGVVEYGSRTVKGADHDGIWWLRWGAVQQVFEAVGETGGRNESGDVSR